MKVAIIGAGFCGLATAWHLLAQKEYIPNLEVTVFDTKEIGSGTSGIAAGLLHYYAGAHAKLNHRGIESFESTKTLLQIASNALGELVYAQDRGIVRLALTENQKHDFYHSKAMQDPYVEWLDESQTGLLIPSCVRAPSLWIKNGLTVYCQLYLKGLWLACHRLGAIFHQTNISSIDQLHEFSRVILTTGAQIDLLPEKMYPQLKAVKGQLLELEWPKNLPPLPCALNSQAYLVMTPDQKHCLVGSTYEREFKDDSVDLEFARQDILSKAKLMIPALENAKIIRGFAGIRAVTPNHLPLMGQVNTKTWYLTGMGSKGLLYHSIMAKDLVDQLLANIHGNKI